MKDQVERQEGQKEAKVERGPVVKQGSLKRESVIVAILKDTETYSDPWDEVDEPLSAAEAADAIAFAEAETEVFLQTILKDCISVAEASRLSGCSRQLLDRLRQDRRLIALRADNRWYYPRWQFEPSAPDGILAGLEEVLRRLYLSPAGAAFWLLQPSEQLGGITPLELLRRHQPETVVQLAEEQGYMP